MGSNVQCTCLSSWNFFKQTEKNLVNHIFACSRAQFAYANSHLHHLHDTVVKALENITYIEPKMKEVSETYISNFSLTATVYCISTTDK